ncbi:MAG: hypothetical protein MK101_01695 [Phycisphaerales bacterium]|nr:hypothetical protein [Phycisphaerales bacterium]
MTQERKSIMRCLGEFAGHIIKAVKQPTTNRTTIRHEHEEEKRGPVTLRRTVIEEVEGPADAIQGEDPPCS